MKKLRNIVCLLLVITCGYIHSQNQDLLSDLVKKRLSLDSIIYDGRKLDIASNITVIFGNAKTKKHKGDGVNKVGKLSLLANDPEKDLYSNIKWIKYSYHYTKNSYFSFYWPDDYKANNLGDLKKYFFEMFNSNLSECKIEGSKVILIAKTEKISNLRFCLHFN